MTTATETVKGLQAGTWTIDPAHTDVAFVARHMMVSKVRGRFADVAGTIVIGEDVESSSAQATIAVASIDTRDAKRDAHLRSADFFDAETFPSITFVSTGVRPDGDDFRLEGNLTIKDITRPVSLEVEFNGVGKNPWNATVAGFSASTDVDRKDFGLTWNVALETGGVLVADKVKLVLEVEATLNES